MLLEGALVVVLLGVGLCNSRVHLSAGGLESRVAEPLLLFLLFSSPLSLHWRFLLLIRIGSPVVLLSSRALLLHSLAVATHHLSNASRNRFGTGPSSINRLLNHFDARALLCELRHLLGAEYFAVGTNKLNLSVDIITITANTVRSRSCSRWAAGKEVGEAAAVDDAITIRIGSADKRRNLLLRVAEGR